MTDQTNPPTAAGTIADTDALTLDAFKDHLRSPDAPPAAAELMAEFDALEAEVEKLKGQLASAKKSAKASAAPKPPKPRKLGPIDGQPDRETLIDLIAAADTVEIAFSDGEREIEGLAPYAIEGDAWRMTSLGVMLTTPIRLCGPAQGCGPHKVAGYTLILDGKPVAFAKRSDPIDMPAGSTFELTNEVFFG